PAEARRFLDAARGNRLEALYRVALSLGLRQGEILGLQWADVDLDAGTLAVRRQLQRVDGAFRLMELKTAQSRRTLALPAALLAALREHRRRQLEERLLAGERWRGAAWDLVFCTRYGTPLDARNLVIYFKALLTRAGLPDIRFHDLRHSCISLLAAQGVSDRVAMEIAGHSQISLTKNIYTHVYDEAKRQAAEAMDRLLGDA
ncbi:MAG TPA: site-specific integrase, partial [Thermomicrobiales bacterium]|nr:site-specific integrase [Thermomicrobiales bacterium]